MLESSDSRIRVLALRDLAVDLLGVPAAVEWLFTPCLTLVGIVPVAAAWHGAGAALAAAAALMEEAERVAAPV